MGTMEVVKAADMPLAVRSQESVFLPVMSMEVAVERRETIIKFVKQIMVQDQDFGVIPGTSTKPVLLKPGAEKLCNFFGLEPEFIPIFEEMDWTGEKHGGEPFYYIRYRCRLTRNGQVLGVGEGSCNSWESKYRYRNANRKCPECAGEFIIKGKEEYGGGWLCFKKKGGCGAKFDENDKRITDQAVGRVLNTDMADSVNTIQKMAQKRALVPATLLATSGSEFFTQDLEDAPEPPDVQRNTPEQQKELAERRVQETRVMPPVAADSAQPNRGPANKPAGGSPETAERAAPVLAPLGTQDASIPVQLRVIFERLQQGGYGREALRLVKTWMVEAMPLAGEGEHARLVRKYGLEGKTGTVADCKLALLEMYRVIEFARAQKAKADGSYEATDDDVPRFDPVADPPAAGELFETTKDMSYAND